MRLIHVPLLFEFTTHNLVIQRCTNLWGAKAHAKYEYKKEISIDITPQKPAIHSPAKPIHHQPSPSITLRPYSEMPKAPKQSDAEQLKKDKEEYLKLQEAKKTREEAEKKDIEILTPRLRKRREEDAERASKKARTEQRRKSIGTQPLTSLASYYTRVKEAEEANEEWAQVLLRIEEDVKSTTTTAKRAATAARHAKEELCIAKRLEKESLNEIARASVNKPGIEEGDLVAVALASDADDN